MVNLVACETRTEPCLLHIAIQKAADDRYKKALQIVELLLLHKNININMVDTNGQTPLHIAVEMLATNVKKAERIVKLLLSRKEIDVNLLDRSSRTPLHLAVGQKGDKSQILTITKELLKFKNIKVNVPDKDGKTVLHYAICCCWPVTEKKKHLLDLILKQRDIYVNMKDMHGRTPLHYCVYKCEGKTDLLKKLLSKRDINVNLKDATGFSAIHYAAMKNSSKNNLKFLIESGKIDSSDINVSGGKCCETALHKAVLTSKEEVVTYLLRNKEIDVNKRDKDGKTPLHVVCEKGKSDRFLQLLLDVEDVEVNLKDYAFKTPLHYAASRSKNSVALKLLTEHRNIKLNLVDRAGKTALHYCSMIKVPDMIKVLFAHKNLDVDIKDRSGRTALINHASVGGNINIIKEFINRGKNIASVRDDNGLLPADHANQNGYTDIREVLKAAHNGKIIISANKTFLSILNFFMHNGL